MCGGKDNSAKIAAQQEAQRQQRIREGTMKIDDTFGQFNDDFYSNRSKAYADFYLPELDRQYKQASDQLINRLGGNINGSEGAKAMGDLTRRFEAEKARLTQSSLDFANDARLTTANQRASLISQLEGGGSVENTGGLAQNFAQGLARQANFSPLADLFGSSTAQFANAANAEGNGFAPVDTGFFNSRGTKSVKDRIA